MRHRPNGAEASLYFLAGLLLGGLPLHIGTALQFPARGRLAPNPPAGAVPGKSSVDPGSKTSVEARILMSTDDGPPHFGHWCLGALFAVLALAAGAISLSLNITFGLQTSVVAALVFALMRSPPFR